MYQHTPPSILSYPHLLEETKTLEQAKADFIKFQTTRDLSSKTVSWHDHCLSDFVQYANASEVYQTHELTDDVIIDWIMQLRTRKVRGKTYSARTISWYTRSLHAWLMWLNKRGLVAGTIAEIAKVKKQSAKLEILSLEEINDILQACSEVSPDTKQMIRNIAIVTLLYDTGIRLSELCGLQMQDIDNWKRRLYPHLLRHSFATEFLNRGGNLEQLRLLLGHEDIQAVLHYTHFSVAHTQNAKKQFGPGNKMKIPVIKRKK